MEKTHTVSPTSEELETELTSNTVLKSKIEVAPPSCLQKAKKIMNPPILATLIAIPLALIPYIKSTIFLGSGAILEDNVMKAVQMIGACSTPIISIILGSNLSNGYPRTADISK